MITMFNRKRLNLDASAQEAARVWSALEGAGIPCGVKTLRNHTAFGRNLHAAMGYLSFHGGMPHSATADQMRYTYVIYVRRGDCERARALVG